MQNTIKTAIIASKLALEAEKYANEKAVAAESIYKILNICVLVISIIYSEAITPAKLAMPIVFGFDVMPMYAIPGAIGVVIILTSTKIIVEIIVDIDTVLNSV